MSKRLLLFVALWALVGCGASGPVFTGAAFKDDGCRDWVRDASGGVTWKANDDVEGIQTFLGEVPGSGFYAFRGAGVVDAPIGKVANVLIDTTRHSEWVPNFGGTHVVRDVSDDTKIIYRHVLTPAVIDDREFVVKVRTHQDEKSGHLLFDFMSVNDEDAPVSDDKVRGIIHRKSGYRMWPVDGGKRTMVVFSIHVDPRGTVPSWIVNLFQDKFPLSNIRNIRAQAAKADVKEHPKVAATFRDFQPRCGADAKAPATQSKAKAPEQEVVEEPKVLGDSGDGESGDSGDGEPGDSGDGESGDVDTAAGDAKR